MPPLLRENGRVTTSELAPRRTFGGIVAVWVTAALAAIAVGIFVPAAGRAVWLAIGLGGCLILAFVLQLVHGRSQGFTERVAASSIGALFVMGVISLGFGLAGIVPA